MNTHRLLLAGLLASVTIFIGILLAQYSLITLPADWFVPVMMIVAVWALLSIFRRTVSRLLVKWVAARWPSASLPASVGDLLPVPDVYPEFPNQRQVPGEEFDQEIREWKSINRHNPYSKSYVREKLVSATKRLLTADDGLTEKEAHESLQNGEWTDDEITTNFLTNSSSQTSFLRTWLTGLIGQSDRETNPAIRTITALMTYAEKPQPQLPQHGFRHKLKLWFQNSDTGLDKQPITESVAKDQTANRNSNQRVISHWQGISVLALSGIATGFALNEAILVLTSVVGVGYTAYASNQGAPHPNVRLTRSLSTTTPNPDEVVTVTLEIYNEGEQTLPDLRVIDGIPEDLVITAGSPRCAIVAQPGDTTSISYQLRARQGVHEFGTVELRSRDIADTVEVTSTAKTETKIICRPTMEPPLPALVHTTVSPDIGQSTAETGGHGIEFHSIKKYQPGDSLNRIDWHRFARTGTLSTISYREEHAAEIVLVIDAREAAHVAPEPYSEDACDRSIVAAGRCYTTYLEAGHRVGLAGLGSESCWIPPTENPKSRAQVREVLTSHPAFDKPPEGDCDITEWLEEFRTRISCAQIVIFSPLCDDSSEQLVSQLSKYGYEVTVISPDPTASRTAGQQFATIERHIRIKMLRRIGVKIIDWSAEKPLGEEIHAQLVG